MKEIPLSGKRANGRTILVSDEDYDNLSRWSWHDCFGYAARGVVIDGKKKKLLMHRVVNDTPDNLATDHINQNKLDNRRENLRSVTRSQNSMNISWSSNNTTGYRGVKYDPKRYGKKYRADIYKERKRIFLGTFKTAIDASRAYEKASLEHHGDYSYLKRSTQ